METVLNAGMCMSVDDYEVIFARQCWHNANVREIATVENDRGFTSQEFRQLLLQVVVQGQAATEERGSEADAPPSRRTRSIFSDLRMGGQP